MTDRKIPEVRDVPPREGERPVRTFNGHVLVHDMWICRPEHLWPVKNQKDELDNHPDWREAIERYLAVFADPIRTVANEIKCPACDKQVTGHPQNPHSWKFFGEIKYSNEGTMEGRCASCGYPCRLKHEIILPSSGLPLVRLLRFPLFYHPSVCEQIN